MKISLSLYQDLDETGLEAFTKWFRSSVVRDDNGPVICYHGSPADIKFFDRKYLGDGNDENGIGFYFTDKEEIAAGYVRGGKMYKVYLRITCPIIAGKAKGITRSQAARLCAGAGTKHFSTFIKDNFDTEVQGLQRSIREYIDANAGIDLINASFNIFNDVWSDSPRKEEFAECFKRVTGYDGVIVDRGKFKNYVVFSAQQIKSVDNKVFRNSKYLTDK